MTPAYAVLALLVVLLVVFPAAAMAIWLVGSRLVRRQAKAVPAVDDEIATLGALDVGGFASSAELAGLTSRERRFLAQTAGSRLAPHDSAAASPRPPRRMAADREVPVAPFFLVCPACGASLGTAADVSHYVGSCPACSRRVASRRRGSRVSLAAVDVERPARRRPSGPNL